MLGSLLLGGVAVEWGDGLDFGVPMGLRWAAEAEAPEDSQRDLRLWDWAEKEERGGLGGFPPGMVRISLI